MTGTNPACQRSNRGISETEKDIVAVEGSLIDGSDVAEGRWRLVEPVGQAGYHRGVTPPFRFLQQER